MRILITTFACDRGKSGVGRYTAQLLREFSEMASPDLEFDVVGHTDEKELFLPPNTNMTFIPYMGSHKPMANILWHQTGLQRLCAKGNYDAVFIPAGNRRLPLHLSCPVVGTVHDLCVLHVPGKYDWIHNVYNLHLLPALIRRLTRVISVSEASKRDIVEYAHVPEDRIEVIYEAADPEQYYPRDKQASQEAVCSRYGIRPPYLLYISRIEHPGKNHVRLIRAFDRLKQQEGIPHQLVFAGSDWHRAETVHEEAAQAVSHADIIFTGFAADADLPNLYCGADAFVFPSLYEGFGLPILEAMACGIPVACSNLSSMPEIAGEAGKLFDPQDEEAISETLHVLLCDENTRTNCIERGLNRAAQFTWQKAAEQTLAALRRAAPHINL